MSCMASPALCYARCLDSLQVAVEQDVLGKKLLYIADYGEKGGGAYE